jgi:hypothetical protein
MESNDRLTTGQPLAENPSSEAKEAPTVQTTHISRAIFADKEFPSDWHVETIDKDSGDIFVALFSGPDAEERAREYAAWQETKELTGRRPTQREAA